MYAGCVQLRELDRLSSSLFCFVCVNLAAPYALLRSLYYILYVYSLNLGHDNKARILILYLVKFRIYLYIKQIATCTGIDYSRNIYQPYKLTHTC